MAQLRPRAGQGPATKTRAIFSNLSLALEVGGAVDVSSVPGARVWVVPAERAAGGWTVDVIPCWLTPVGTRDGYSLRARAELLAHLDAQTAADEDDDGESWKQGAGV